MRVSNGGFSVVELLVALMIFTLGIIATSALLGAGYRYQGQSRLAMQMTVLAETKIEGFRAIAGTDLPDTVALVPGGSLESDLVGYHETTELDGRMFARRWQVESGPAGTRRVTVRVIPVQPPATGRVDLATNLIHD